GSAGLLAVFHALPRLLAPRRPPRALRSLAALTPPSPGPAEAGLRKGGIIFQATDPRVHKHGPGTESNVLTHSQALQSSPIQRPRLLGTAADAKPESWFATTTATQLSKS